MTLDPSLAQLFSVGILWISFHCAGMCGPILCGLDVTGAARGHGVVRGTAALLLYQLGRAFSLCTLGALAGVVGSSVGRGLERGGPLVALVAAAVSLLLAVRSWRGASSAQPLRISTRRSSILGGGRALWNRLLMALQGLGAARPLAIGLVLGFLPCMIVVWALSLAASAGSPARGALVMLGLVAMTTPTLFFSTLLPRLALRRSWLRHAAPMLLLTSSLWLFLVGLAGLAVIDHAHLGFSLAGRSFTVMLW